ncbi:BlaI/MecI/CopY family transcriptional regulator [Litoribacter ruber]|uniref:BlaI/MecI/CopY family transcriptional regulator n=1 Tax=Litoribacter ruber TaxID=702568 RepID=UPI001BDA5F7B|nr:BlaI/MecI/CopY family transcriptional regulator [Litoribacter ruber]MBT0811095.1 BlaI/MecI/CopY family transcriptional regulator [Litoribacter ruber]
MNLKPTESEIEILGLLWETGEASVREVHEKLSVSKDTGYTTTLKQMQVMHAKGLLDRYGEGRGHIYKPAISQKETQTSLVKNFMSLAFGGSAKKLVMQALGQSEPSKEEIAEIRAFLNKLENDK